MLATTQYEGSPARRAELARGAGRHDVVVMSYETLRADVDWAAARPWAYCVLDEGHIIRNPKSKLAQARCAALLPSLLPLLALSLLPPCS